MSETTGFLAIKGDQQKNLPKIFRYFGLTDTQQEWIATTDNQLKDILKKQIPQLRKDNELRITWQQNGWTVIENADSGLFDPEAFKQIAIDFDTSVLYVLTQGTSGNYGFGYFDKATSRRFLIDDGTIAENEGTPIPQEEHFPANEHTGYDEVQGIAKAFGIDYEAVLYHFSIDQLNVKLLKNSEELNRRIGLNIEELEKENAATKKPWWKLW